MFNVFAHDKKSAQLDEFERMKEKYIKDETSRKKQQEKLSLNYKKRVENFVLQMAEKPLATHDYVPAVIKIRDEDPSKFLGSPSFVIRSFKHEKDRIKENIENYKKFQMEYTNNPFEFRKRDVTKEIQPMMRFTSKTNFERVANRLKALMQNPNSDLRVLAKGAENLSDSFILELSKSPQATNKYLASHLLPDLNTKTHFKATHSFFLGLPDALMDKRLKNSQTAGLQGNRKDGDENSARSYLGSQSKFRTSAELNTSQIPRGSKNQSLPPLRQSKTSGALEGIEDKKEIGKLQTHIETVNPIDVSEKVLTKCNIIRQKKENTRTLKKGSGHLMSMSERTLREVYEQVYHKSIESSEIKL